MIAVVIGGRDRHPTLAEFERVAAELGPEAVTVLRHSTAYAPGKQGTERTVARYVTARGLADVEPWPSRTAAMLGDLVRPPAELVIALDGGADTQAVIRKAEGRGIPVIRIGPVAEPKIWNRHHGTPPGPSIYVGRNQHDPGKASPLGNLAGDLEQYRRWLGSRLRKADRDQAVAAAIEEITAAHFVICSCWPNPCHGEVIVRAWRWWNSDARREVERA
jgi:hypothetical protein